MRGGYERSERHNSTVDQRKSAMTQSASGSVSVSWERARVSARMRVKNPKDKRLVFIGLCGLVCLGPFGLGAILAQGVRCGNNKNAHFLCTWCVDVLASEAILVMVCFK